MKRLDIKMAAGIGLCAVLLVSGCVLPDDLFDHDPCDIDSSAGAEPARVAGIWRLEGTGEWTGCRSGVQDGTAFDLSAPPLTVVQHEDPDDPDQDVLVLEGGPEGFEFSGVVRGTCVDVETTDNTTGETITFTFEGNYTSRNEITGEFRGIGPGSCDSDGDFEIDIDSPI